MPRLFIICIDLFRILQLEFEEDTQPKLSLPINLAFLDILLFHLAFVMHRQLSNRQWRSSWASIGSYLNLHTWHYHAWIYIWRAPLKTFWSAKTDSCSLLKLKPSRCELLKNETLVMACCWKARHSTKP